MLANFFDKFPGKRYFGQYRFLPLYFCLGAFYEWLLVNLQVGKTNFYDVYTRKHKDELDAIENPGVMRRKFNPDIKAFQEYDAWLAAKSESER